MLRLLRIIADFPLTPFILILYIALDLVWIGTRHGVIDTLASRSANAVTGPMRSIQWGGNTVDIIREADGMERLWLGPGRKIDSRQFVGSLSVFSRGPATGIWAPTHRRSDFGIFHSSYYQGFSPLPLSVEDLARLRREYFDQFKTTQFPHDILPSEIVALTQGQSVYRITHHPLGYLHNTLSLFMFAMLCWSLRLNIPKLWRRRIDPTKCPHCRYSTIGLTTNTCPECGNCISTSD